MTRSFILHIDMNSYFASVEQQANPLLRGKPVGVCAYLSKNGCIIASSKESKKYGIKAGCSIASAREKYPDIILVENEPAKYRSTTEKIFSMFQEYTDCVEPYSIDEAFLDLTGYISTFDEGVRIMDELRVRVREEVGEWLTCSMGLSWTRFLAKFASDITPADSRLVIDSKEKMIEVFDGVQLTEAWGIGEGLERRLHQLRIYSLNDLRKAHPGNLMQALGKMGYYIWAHTNGIEIEGVHTGEEMQPKSIGHTYCIPQKTNDLKYILPVMMKLCERTGTRLRGKKLEAYGIYAGYTLRGGGSFLKRQKTQEPLYTSWDIYKAAERIIRLSPPPNAVKMLAVSVHTLRPETGQLNLFSVKNKKSISKALDAVNGRYGSYTIIHGKMWGLEHQALDRIGFRKSVDLHEIIEDTRYAD